MEKPSLLGVPDPNGETETRRGEAAEPLMAGKRGLVMGVANERSIAWGIARALHAQGAALAFSYQGEAFERPAQDALVEFAVAVGVVIGGGVGRLVAGDFDEVPAFRIDVDPPAELAEDLPAHGRGRA